MPKFLDDATNEIVELDEDLGEVEHLGYRPVLGYRDTARVSDSEWKSAQDPGWLESERLRKTRGEIPWDFRFKGKVH